MPDQFDFNFDFESGFDESPESLIEGSLAMWHKLMEDFFFLTYHGRLSMADIKALTPCQREWMIERIVRAKEDGK